MAALKCSWLTAMESRISLVSRAKAFDCGWRFGKHPHLRVVGFSLHTDFKDWIESGRARSNVMTWSGNWPSFLWTRPLWTSFSINRLLFQVNEIHLLTCEKKGNLKSQGVLSFLNRQKLLFLPRTQDFCGPPQTSTNKLYMDFSQVKDTSSNRSLCRSKSYTKHLCTNKWQRIPFKKTFFIPVLFLLQPPKLTKSITQPATPTHPRKRVTNAGQGCFGTKLS